MTAEGPRPIVITIDGPAGSGKSTTAREVARRLGYRHLDSGALYRALALAVRRAGIPVERWDALTDDTLEGMEIGLALRATRLRVRLEGRDPGPELRAPETTRLASRLATNPRARARLSGILRSALDFGSLVADGRDMGTVIFPDADLKVFLTADLEERARRRLLQAGQAVDAGGGGAAAPPRSASGCATIGIHAARSRPSARPPGRSRSTPRPCRSTARCAGSSTQLQP